MSRPPAKRTTEADAVRDAFSPNGSMFLGKQADALSVRIERECVPILAEADIQIPVRSCSLMLALREAGDASATDLAKTLGQSHQLVLQKVPTLIELGFVERQADPRDQRRRLLTLTQEGREQVARLLECETIFARMYRDLFEEIDVDLFAALGRALDALETRTLLDRYRALAPSTPEEG